MGGKIRTAQALKDDKWVDIKPMDIKRGMVFKLFEADGTPVIWKDKDIFTATSDAHMNEIFRDGIVQVKIM